MKKKLTKWLSSTLVLAMIFTTIPLTHFSTVYATDSIDQSTSNLPQNQVSESTRKELVDKRTETSKTFLNPDGTLTTEISQKPIHFKNNRKEWQPIENELVENQKEQVYENKANAFKVKFDQEQKTDSPFMELEDEQTTVEFELEPLEHTDEMAAKSEAVVEGESITYPNVYQNIDIKYTIGNDRVKEDIIYNEKPSEGFPEQFTYKMNLNGMSVKESDGILYLYDDEKNEPLYYFDMPYMYDSFIPDGFQSVKEFESVPEEAMSYDIQLQHEVVDNQLFLHVIPNKEWLEDDNRVYPITIDPTLVKLQGSNYVEDTNIRSGFPTQTGGNDTELGAGRSGTNIIRGLLKFDVSSIPAGSVIISSNMNLWYSSTNNKNPINVSIHNVTKGWTENQANWNSAKTSPLTPWTSKGGDYTSSPLSTNIGLSEVPDLAIAEIKWDIPTSIIGNWINNAQNNNGLLLKSDSENTEIYKKFVSSEHTIGNQFHPKIIVTYKTPARLGLEDYWQYDTHSLVGGASYTNLATSNNVIQYEDFSVIGRADSGFSFVRTYNSKDLEKSALGNGWTFTGNEKLFVSSKGIQYYDEDGTTHEFVYNRESSTYIGGAGNLKTIKSSALNTYTLSYPDGTSKIFKIAKANTDVDMDIAYIQTIIDRNGNKTNFTYDAKNQLIKIATDLGNSISKAVEIQYNSMGLIQSIKYNDRAFEYKYNTAGYLEFVDEYRYINGDKTTTQFIYKNNRITTIIDPNGRKTDYTYENENLVKVQEPQEINGVKDPNDRPGISYTLDSAAKIATVTDAEGNLTKYQVNENFVPIIVTDSAGIITEYDLDKNYNILTETEIEDGIRKVIQTNKYDSQGNLLASTDAEGNKQTYTYNNLNLVLTYIDSNEKVSTYKYDSKGNLVESKTPKNSSEFLTTTYTYNSYGDLLVSSSSDGIKEEFEIDYTSSIKTISYTDANGNVSITKEDLSGNLLNSRDGEGNWTSYTYNLKNELEKVVDSKNNPTSYGYDKNGNLLSITNALGAKTSFQYNGQNLIESETNALGNTTNYLYDANGTITQVTKPNGQVIQYQEDEATASSSVVVNGETKWKYVKDGEDQLIYGENESSLKRISYYDNGLVKSVDPYGVNGMISYTYNGNEYLSGIEYRAYNGWNNISFVPDDAYNTIEIKLNDVNLASFNYNDSGLLQNTKFKNGNQARKEYLNDRLDRETLVLSEGLEFNSYQYGYNLNNSITSIHSNNGTTEYEYDELNQLTKEILPDGTMIEYAYDKVGNRISKNTTVNGVTKQVPALYNAANQLVQVDNKTFTYDLNGNLTSDGERTYAYNEFDQLVMIKDSIGNVIAEYAYDEEGRRVYSNDSNGRTLYTYNGNQVLFEEDANLNVVKSYTYNDEGHPLTMFYKGVTYYYLTNYRGDVLAMTDESGNVVASYSYDAWGNILSQSGEMATINPYRYAGYRYDEDTKLYYLMARYYDPNTGVFLSIDPVRGDAMTPITMNGYNYANNNPVMNVDPDGNIAVKYYVTRTTYALVTGLIYVFSELVGGVTGINIISSFILSIMNYKVTVNARRVTSMSEAMSLAVRNPNYFKDIKKEARKTALKFGIKTLLPLSAVTHSIIFATGITKGWKYYDKYKNKNMINFGLHVYKKHGTAWF